MVEQTAVFELTTGLTDGLLALACALCGLALLRKRESPAKTTAPPAAPAPAEQLMAAFLLLLCGGLVLGGTYHVLPAGAISATGMSAIWALTSAVVSAAFALLVATTLADLRGGGCLSPMWATALCCAAAAGPGMSSVLLNSFAPLLVWELLCIGAHMAAHALLLVSAQQRRRRSLLVLLGDLCVVLGGVVQRSAAEIWPFDHNGLYHLVQLPAVVLIWIAYTDNNEPSVASSSSSSSPFATQQAFMAREQCIRVDEDDRVIGHASKLECHTGHGLLHRAFSVLLFDLEGRLLLQRRSAHKITFPLMWANTCCSHPLFVADELAEVPPGIGAKRAAQRKLLHELGISPRQIPLDNFVYLTRILYQAPSDAEWKWSENEIDYILVFVGAVDVTPNPEEVAETRYITRDELAAMFADPVQAATVAPWMLAIGRRFLFRWWDALLQQRAAGDIAAVYKLAEFQDHHTIHRIF